MDKEAILAAFWKSLKEYPEVPEPDPHTAKFLAVIAAGIYQDAFEAGEKAGFERARKLYQEKVR